MPDHGMYVEQAGRFVPLLQVLDGLAARGVALRLLHAELPSRPFRAEFDKRSRLVRGGLELKVCPRVHFKTVLVDGAWAYLGSANLIMPSATQRLRWAFRRSTTSTPARTTDRATSTSIRSAAAAGPPLAAS